MISTRSGVLVIDTVVSLTLRKWETVSGQFGGNFTLDPGTRDPALPFRVRLEAVWKRDFTWCGPVIQALDVDRAEPWPDGQDRQEDEALPV